MTHISQYMKEAGEIIDHINQSVIQKMVEMLVDVREKGGRVFFLGVGGGAANATHAVNDFRKIAGIEAYTPVDNVSELTARTNDEGWETVFVEWLKESKLKATDMVFVFSVGGGNREKNVSVNIVNALEHAKSIGAKICGVVGRDGGYTKKIADACVIIPSVNQNRVTPHTESFQIMISHLLVSHPDVCIHKMKWESIK